jgi:DNA-directed RNA polymerase specialized sigma subunit
MSESSRRHLDEILLEYGAKVEKYLQRREYLFSLLSSSSPGQRVQGGGFVSSVERTAEGICEDRQLKVIMRFLEPISNAIAALDWQQRQIIESQYVIGMDREAIMREMGISQSNYFREKRRAMDAIGHRIFGQYA